jgi:hypothetical protein
MAAAVVETALIHPRLVLAVVELSALFGPELHEAFHLRTPAIFKETIC